MRAVVFDLDGTLVDSYDAIADSLSWARAARGLPPMSGDEVRYEVGHGLESLIEKHVGPDDVSGGVARFRERYREIFLQRTVALPGVPEIPAALAARGLALGVASNKPEAFLTPILAAVGLGDVVRVALGPAPDRPAKPDPAILLAVLERLGVPPGAALYIGDMPLDAETARRAGCRAVLVEGGSALPSELRAVAGARVLGSLREVPVLLADLGAG